MVIKYLPCAIHDFEQYSTKFMAIVSIVDLDKPKHSTLNHPFTKVNNLNPVTGYTKVAMSISHLSCIIGHIDPSWDNGAL